MIGRLLLALAVAGQPAVARAAAPGNPALQRRVVQLFNDRHLDGALVARDLPGGRIAVSARIGSGAYPLPLSAAKLFLAAIYFDRLHQLGGRVEVDPDLVIARGSDDAGRKLALDLRRALGTRTFLADLARLGFPACTARRTRDCTTLSVATPDKLWSDTMSIGESGFNVTLAGLTQFAALVGNDGRRGRQQVIGTEAARRLQAAMLETVRSGTARGSSGDLAGLGSMGGKTGSTTLGEARPLDGLFAGLIFDRFGRPRYAIATFVRRGGFGGGTAAQVSAAVGAALLSEGDRVRSGHADQRP